MSMLEYEPEKFPQGLTQGPKMAINLRPPSGDHWNIAMDLVLPLAVDTFRRRREAKRAAQGLGGESEGAKVSSKEAPVPGESPQVVAGSSGAALPTETTYQGERALETACEILEHIHAIRLQTMHEMGGVRELERTLVRTLMAEFARLQLILGEDLTKSLTALRSELETSSEALSSDLVRTLNLHSDDLAFPQVKELIQKYQQSISMKVNLPLMELGMSPQNKLPIGVPGDDRGTLSDFISPHQQDTGSHSGPWTPRASRVPVSYGRTSHGPASRGYFLPRHPGWVDWEARLDTSRCSSPTHFS